MEDIDEINALRKSATIIILLLKFCDCRFFETGNRRTSNQTGPRVADGGTLLCYGSKIDIVALTH
uniref:Uncharacterized protein n=1 Tax=Megaselia scalaris TaxID=36166 RepID=T1GUH2_MEGSC